MQTHLRLSLQLLHLRCKVWLRLELHGTHLHRHRQRGVHARILSQILLIRAS
jgi:hypothetical protein